MMVFVHWNAITGGVAAWPTCKMAGGSPWIQVTKWLMEGNETYGIPARLSGPFTWPKGPFRKLLPKTSAELITLRENLSRLNMVVADFVPPLVLQQLSAPQQMGSPQMTHQARSSALPPRHRQCSRCDGC